MSVPTTEEMSCPVNVCVDPATGKLKMKVDDDCPDGFIEKCAGAAAARGLDFERVSGDGEA